MRIYVRVGNNSGEDFQAVKLTLRSLDKKFELGLDSKELDEKISGQNLKITNLREENSDINRYIGMLEGRLSLSAEEQMELIKEITEILEETG
ncbi:MAG: hypothetical protein ACYS6W_03495 [Planctomycetota bacterium]|jgi:hypothetical protein